MTSWTLSGFADEIDDDPRIQFAVLRALGAGHADVRSAWGTGVLDLDTERLQSLAAIAREAGITVSVIASPIGKSPAGADPGDERRRLARAVTAARILGTPFVRMFSFFPDAGRSQAQIRDDVLHRLSLLARDAEAAGVVLLHENEKRIYGDIPERVLDVVESVGSPALRLTWDSANFVQVGVAPFTQAYAPLHEHVVSLQIKDAHAGTGIVCPAGAGDGELPETIAAFRDDGFCGVVSLEPHLPAVAGRPGVPGPEAFGLAARAFRALTDAAGIELV
ncbi:MAG: sugar phosphate isomerase/epimerase family protein [Microbacteriaceae bacterium]